MCSFLMIFMMLSCLLHRPQRIYHQAVLHIMDSASETRRNVPTLLPLGVTPGTAVYLIPIFLMYKSRLY